MTRIVEVVAALTLLVLLAPACENFTSVTAEVPLDTGDKIKFGFDIGAEIKKANPSFEVDDPQNPGQKIKMTLSDLLKENNGKLPPGIKQTVTVPIPPIPVPTDITNNPDIAPYKSKIYNVRIDKIRYTFAKNSLPTQIKLNESLLAMTDSTGKDVVGVAYLPEISGDIQQGTQMDGKFAPGGQDAASDLLASLDFGVKLLVSDNGGNFTQTAISISIDTDKDQSVPEGAFELTIMIQMVFRVAPLA